MAQQCGTGRSATPDQKPLQSPKVMQTATQLDQRRADFMELLHEHFQAQNLYTGLWEKFAYELATRFRDLDYDMVRNDIIRGFAAADVELAGRHADVAVTVLIRHLMPEVG